MAIGGSGRIETGLGGAIGLGEILVPRNDDGSFALDVSGLFRDGLTVFGTLFRFPILYINTNGTVSFDAPVEAYITADLSYSVPVLAPFWGDVDTRLDGEGAESGAIWADIDSITGVLTVTWSQVGVYRRNADLSNLFQMQIFDQGGGDFDVAFRFESIEWSIGTAEDDLGARAGLFDPFGADLVFGPSNVVEIDETIGNSGEKGLWTYSVTDGQIRDYSSQTLPILGSDGDDGLTGSASADHLLAYLGNDTLSAGAGSDTIDAGSGDDFVFGGLGNDQIYGRDGNDNMRGDEGSDQIFGDNGQDILTGSSRSDALFGGNGDDFLNGGWGHDTLTGGSGADKFYHEGIPDHGNDWVTDFYAPEGDTLVFGGARAQASDFIVQYAETPNKGQTGVAEAFVTYVPTGQILWAIEDGSLAQQISVWTSEGVFELI